MAVSEQSAAEVLAKCARHCCICRRFRPLHLQVHHVVEHSEGGSDDIDNLIAICITCHADVHTSPALTRRFTAAELRMHRDSVYKLVESGRLPAEVVDENALEVISAKLIERLRGTEGPADDPKLGIPTGSLDILLAAVCEDAPIANRGNDPLPWLQIGSRGYFPREEADGYVSSVLNPLLEKTLIERTPDGAFVVTDAGFSLADDLISSDARFTAKKVHCRFCGLHFELFTWYPDRHCARNLHCPECGQHQGLFSVWQQQESGFIFEHVPGHALPLE
jgi:hypothetical protein